jgi:hypothetical protein
MELDTSQEPNTVVEEPTVTTEAEGQGTATTETTETVQKNPDEQFLVKAVVDGQEQVFDIRDQEQRKSLQDNVQKGIHYTKKMQSVSEWEKANQAQMQFGQSIVSDPDTLEILVAKENGLNPASLYGNPNPPSQAIAETNPVEYAQQLFAYQSMMWEREKIKALARAKGSQQASIANQAMYEKSRIENELTDQEYAQVIGYMNNFRPNIYGMYSRDQMDAAVMFVTGKSKAAQREMNTISKIDRSIRTAAQTMSTTQKLRTLPPVQAERDKFHDFVRDVTKKRS